MDGKNREEQENGAKVRDLEEYKAENRKRKRRRRITVGILAGAILAAGIGTGVWLQLRTFQGYDTVQVVKDFMSGNVGGEVIEENEITGEETFVPVIAAEPANRLWPCI